uniref:Reverse transcriptase zinc-binding domain-containing protein n=1 Tax=Chenopodium quinoa TaxID=63459 RepID=A0A803N5D5_CHEQI
MPPPSHPPVACFASAACLLDAFLLRLRGHCSSPLRNRFDAIANSLLTLPLRSRLTPRRLQCWPCCWPCCSAYSPQSASAVWQGETNEGGDNSSSCARRLFFKKGHKSDSKEVEENVSLMQKQLQEVAIVPSGGVSNAMEDPIVKDNEVSLNEVDKELDAGTLVEKVTTPALIAEDSTGGDLPIRTLRKVNIIKRSTPLECTTENTRGKRKNAMEMDRLIEEYIGGNEEHVKVVKRKETDFHIIGEGRHLSGGLAMFWKGELNLTLISTHLNHMDFTLATDDGLVWRLTGIYGFPKEGRKNKTWKLIERLGEDSTLPWLCFGDFNYTLTHGEKKGGNPKNQNEIDSFRDSMNKRNLRDLHFKALAKRRSDHVPLEITIQKQLLINRGKRNRKKSFNKFKKEWLRDDECGNIISDAWNLDPSCNVKQKIAACSLSLRSWSSKKSIDFKDEIGSRRELMGNLMKLPLIEDNIAEMRRIDLEIDELEGREEAFWAQRSRQDWLREGDRNTTFFLKKAKQRLFSPPSSKNDSRLLVLEWIDVNEEGHKFWNMGQWKGTKNGEFTVRSAYHFELQRSKSNAGPSNIVPDVKLWRKIWEASVPPKVKSVTWRAVRGGLPVRAVLSTRGMKIGLGCGEECETIMHMLAFCPESQIIGSSHL